MIGYLPILFLSSLLRLALPISAPRWLRDWGSCFESVTFVQGTPKHALGAVSHAVSPLPVTATYFPLGPRTVSVLVSFDAACTAPAPDEVVASEILRQLAWESFTKHIGRRDSGPQDLFRVGRALQSWLDRNEELNDTFVELRSTRISRSQLQLQDGSESEEDGESTPCIHDDTDDDKEGVRMRTVGFSRRLQSKRSNDELPFVVGVWEFGDGLVSQSEKEKDATDNRGWYDTDIVGARHRAFVVTEPSLPTTTRISDQHQHQPQAHPTSQDEDVLSWRIVQREVSGNGFHRILRTIVRIGLQITTTYDNDEDHLLSLCRNVPSVHEVHEEEVGEVPFVALGLLERIPEGAYVDLDELERVMDGSSTSTTTTRFFDVLNRGVVDVEKPVDLCRYPVYVDIVVSSWDVARRIAEACEEKRKQEQGVEVEVEIDVVFEIPIHVRYHPPREESAESAESVEGNATHAFVLLQEPLGLRILLDGVGSIDAVQKDTDADIDRAFDITLAVPVGRSKHRWFVTYVTLLVTVGGALLILVAVLRPT